MKRLAEITALAQQILFRRHIEEAANPSRRIDDKASDSRRRSVEAQLQKVVGEDQRLAEIASEGFNRVAHGLRNRFAIGFRNGIDCGAIEPLIELEYGAVFRLEGVSGPLRFVGVAHEIRRGLDVFQWSGGLRGEELRRPDVTVARSATHERTRKSDSRNAQDGKRRLPHLPSATPPGDSVIA